MRRLRLPAEFSVPESTPHLKELLAAYADYQRRGFWNAPPVAQADYELVCKYVDAYGDPAYALILNGGMQGQSLIAHELAELEYFIEQSANPFERIDLDPERDRQLYARGHALGLIREHRFIQRRASADGRNFRLGELIRWNPVSEYPEFDLEVVRQYARETPGGEVSEADLELREGVYREAVYAWYRRQKFAGNYPTA